MITVQVIGYRDKAGRFSEAWGWLIDRRRQRLEEWGQRLVEKAVDLSPKAMRARQLDERKRGETPFSEQWYYDIVPGSGTEETLVLDNRSPIRDIVLFPTRPHRIPKGGKAEMMAKGYPLRWYDLETGQEIRAWEVQHPGTKGAYTHERVYEEMEPEMVVDLQKLAAQTAAMMEG